MDYLFNCSLLLRAHNDNGNANSTVADDNNKGQRRLAKGDIALESFSPGGSTRREVAHGRCIYDTHLGEGRS